jgi:hypothetical protein
MKTSKIFIILSVLFVFGFIRYPYIFAQYVVQNSVFGNGGTVITNEKYQINSTTGQTVVDTVSSTNNSLKLGFWYSSGDLITKIEQISDVLPETFWLGQNYPNPFNSRTKIHYAIKHESKVVLKLFNIMGQEVKTILDHHHMPGQYEIEFNAGEFTSGIYFYRIYTENFSSLKKMVILE